MIKNFKKAKITGISSYLPEKVLTNKEFEKFLDTSDEWILQRTGIQERRIAAKEETTSDMGAAACKLLLEERKISAENIDFIIVATMTPDFISSSTASIIQNKIGAHNAACVDIQAACTGFLYALSIARAYIESKTYKNILIVCSEKMSSVTNYEDRSTSILFGDGASAIFLEQEGSGFEIEHLILGSDGSLSHLITIPAGGSKNPTSKETLDNKEHFIRLEGKEVFKHAINRMAAVCEKCLEETNVKSEELAWIVPHQANLRIIDGLSKKLQISQEKIVKTVEKFANTSASSVPLALDVLKKTKSLKNNDLILLTAFGAGLTWGSALLKYVEENDKKL